jgi:hypothetical protein
VVTDRTIDSHIKNLRRKLEALDAEQSFIRAVYGGLSLGSGCVQDCLVSRFNPGRVRRTATRHNNFTSPATALQCPPLMWGSPYRAPGGESDLSSEREHHV